MGTLRSRRSPGAGFLAYLLLKLIGSLSYLPHKPRPFAQESSHPLTQTNGEKRGFSGWRKASAPGSPGPLCHSPQPSSGPGTVSSLAAAVSHILWNKASSPHCTDGAAEDPRREELQAAMSHRGSWEAARPCLLSLEATACVSCSHWCLGKGSVGSRRQAAAGRTPPVPAGRPQPLAACLGPEPTLHADLAFRSLE